MTTDDNFSPAIADGEGAQVGEGTGVRVNDAGTDPGGGPGAGPAPGVPERLARMSYLTGSGVSYEAAVLRVYGERGARAAFAADLAAAAASPQEGGGGLDPAWSRELPPMPPTVKFHAVGAGLALRHDLNCPMRKVIYDNHGDPCNCRESERRCERTAEVAYFAGVDAPPPPAGMHVDRDALVARLREAFPVREFLWREGDTFGRLTPETLADLLAKTVTDE